MQETLMTLLSSIGVLDVIDVAIIAFVIYKVLGFIRETRAEQLVKGLLVLVIATVLSGILHLNALNWLLVAVSQITLIALVIIFQPELRRGLEFMGRSRFLRPQFAGMDKDKAKAATQIILKTADYFSQNKVGALIIIEQEIALNDFAQTGVHVGADLSPELLENIFYEGAPLHDGGVIVKGGIVLAAACVLPLARNRDLSAELGMRHRAGLGITEVSDAIAVIVSEETGVISTAKDGVLTRFIDVRTLEKTLLSAYLTEEGGGRAWPLSRIFGRKKDVPQQ